MQWWVSQENKYSAGFKRKHFIYLNIEIFLESNNIFNMS